jgi:hypothetical protein
MPASEPWSRFERRALAGFLVCGTLLRLLQLASNPAQWLDEAMLSWSLVERGVGDLLSRPLMYGQSAPPGYLVLERLCVVAFGPSDWVLRLIPFLASVTTLFACVPLAKSSVFGAGRVALVGLVALAAPFILYAGQAKQYSLDVVASVLLLVLGQTLLARIDETGAPQPKPFELRLALLAGAYGALSVWLSLPAVFTLVALSSALLVAALRKRSWSDGFRLVLALAPLLVVWGASALGAALFNRRSMTPEMLQTLYVYWEAAFMPRSPISEVVIWPVRAIARIFRGTESAGLYYAGRPLFMLLMAGGMVMMARRSLRSALLFGMPIALALLAGAARQYPFADRLVMFLIPHLLVFVTEGLGQLCWHAARWQPRVGRLLPIAVYGLAAVPLLQTPPPYRSEDMKPLFERLAAERKPGDTLYVYYGSLPAYQYYVKRGLASPDYLAGPCHHLESRKYLHDLDRLRGTKRLWVMLVHSHPPYREIEDLTAYLDAIGHRRAELIVPGRGPANSANLPQPAALYLYDLSDPTKGASASAEHFKLLGRTDGDSRLACD